MERPGPAHRRPPPAVFSDRALVVDQPLPRKVGTTRLVFLPPTSQVAEADAHEPPTAKESK